MNTISECLNKAVHSGYSKDFFVSSGGLFFKDAERYYQPEEVMIRNFYRFEGESDPGDSSILYLLQTEDGTKGTLLDAYGVYSDKGISAFVKNIGRTRKQLPSAAPHIRRKVMVAMGALTALFFMLWYLRKSEKIPSRLRQAFS
ncbi:hypothetical protein K7B07_18625 [Niabella sp. 3A5MI-3]|nr:hypothetical protein [Niabella beijingensis]